MNYPTSAKPRLSPIVIIGILFFIFGFVTWLNGTLIPFLKIACQLDDLQALFVAFAFYIAYFVMALPSSIVIQKLGYKNGMMLGLVIIALGSLIFIPAALRRTFGLFLTGLFIQGTGLALLQTASNPYIIIIGPRESAARRIAIMGICNKVAGVISPLILSTIVLAGANKIIENLKTITGTEKIDLLNSLSHRVIVPYLVMAVVLALLAFMIKFTHLPDVDTENDVNTNKTSDKKALWQFFHLILGIIALFFKALWQFPHLILGFIALFFYVGAEVIAGDTIGLYGQSLHIPLEKARFFTSLTLGSMVIGYILGIITIPRFINQSKALAVSAILGLVFTAGSLVTNGMTSVFFIALLGLANAMMWPSIFPLAIEDLGKFTKTGSAILIMGIAGGATLPLVYGRLAKTFSNQSAYLLLIPLYFFILYFAISGHKIRK